MRTIPKPQFDANSGTPLYKQLHAQLRRWVESGVLAKGQKLPSTRQLAGWIGLNRTTVSAAYSLLEAEGLIQGHVGRGSFVTGGPSAREDGFDWDELLSEADRYLPPLAATPLPAGAQISFASSRPSESLFPVEEVRRACEEVLSGAQAPWVLQLGSPQGYGPLLERLLAQARQEGLAGPQDDVLITSGCQQGLDLVQRVLVRPGDAVVVEDPVYPGVRNLFLRAGARVVGVPVGPQGMEPDQLERALSREKARLLVVTPSFQNPTGTTIPPAVRQAILDVARSHGTVVVENDIYGELRYEGGPIPPLRRFAGGQDVVLLRSFSKIAFPGLRVGWITAPRALVARLTEAKNLCDLHSDQLSQAVLLRFAETGRLAAHHARVLEAGREQLRAVLAACERHLPPGSQFSRPQGGMNVWVRLPDPLDAWELLPRSEAVGVSYLPGRYFEVTRRVPGGLRLSFAALTPERISAGVAAMGRVFLSELERVRALEGSEPAPAVV